MCKVAGGFVRHIPKVAERCVIFVVGSKLTYACETTQEMQGVSVARQWHSLFVDNARR